MEASALLCRSSLANRVAAKHRETLRAARKTLLFSPSRKQVHKETISGISVILVRFYFLGRAVKTSSVLLGKCHVSHRCLRGCSWYRNRILYFCGSLMLPSYSVSLTGQKHLFLLVSLTSELTQGTAAQKVTC